MAIQRSRKSFLTAGTATLLMLCLCATNGPVAHANEADIIAQEIVDAIVESGKSTKAKGRGKRGESSNEPEVPLTPSMLATQQIATINTLMEREEALKEQITKLKGEISVVRDSLTANMSNPEAEFSEEEYSQIMAAIHDMEHRLFDKSSEAAALSSEIVSIQETEELGSIEIFEEGEYIDSGIYETDNATRLTGSRILSKNLQLKNYNALYEADMAEGITFSLHTEYVEQYEELRECAEKYAQCATEKESLELEAEFRDRASKLDSLSTALERQWGAIYDDKSFTYGLLLETLGFDELLRRWDLLANDAAERSSQVKQAGVASDAVIDYEYQKRALSQLEHDIASRLNMPYVIDSMDNITHRFRLSEANDMPEVSITRRSFIVYEPLKFLPANSNQTGRVIHKTKMYSNGSIYRILVGVFKTRQEWSTFRGAYPVSYEQIEGGSFYAYYVGGFPSMMDALAAQAACKKQGFSRVDIVLWQDGAEGRNLTRNPIGKNGFRVRIDNLKTVTPEIKALIEKHAGKQGLMKVGATSYILAKVKGYAEAEALQIGIEQLAPNARVALTEL